MNAKSDPRLASPDLKSPHRVLAVIATILATVLRILWFVKPPNFHANGALGTYGGARAPLWQALFMTLASMAISDLVLKGIWGFTPFNPFVYCAMIAYVLLGRLLLRKAASAWRIGGVTLLGSVLFFVVTNFGVWYAGIGKANALYAPTAAGLIQCYTMGLRLFGYTLAGDVGFALVLFGAHAWVADYVTSRERPPVEDAAR
jgi:hypothetical protein